MCDSAVRNDYGIRGTKVHVRNGLISISSGHQVIDELLGGGIAIGSLLVIEEDKYGSYAESIAKYFLGEGHDCGHRMFLASYRHNKGEVLSSIPKKVEMRNSSTMGEEKSGSGCGRMKIAWRYADLQNKPSPVTQFEFDLSKKVSATELVDDNDAENFENLLAAIRTRIESENFAVQNVSKTKNLLRICLLSPANLLLRKTTNGMRLSAFLFHLKMMLRSAFATALITVPVHLLSKDEVGSVRHVADYVLSLKPFGGTALEKNMALSKYHGFFNLIKLPSLNSIVPTNDLTTGYVFKLTSRSFLIEKLVLPPEKLPEQFLLTKNCTRTLFLNDFKTARVELVAIQ